MSWKTWLTAAAVSMLALPVAAQSQPVIRFVSGSAPGGSVDVLARVLAEPMSESLGRTIIVENRPGAGYTIATDHVAKAKPDGNTVLITFNVHPTFGTLHANLGFDPVKDFRAVGMIASTSYVVVAHPQVPGNDLKEMVERAKAENRSPTFGSIGLGTPQHLMMERLKSSTGVDIRMIHYKGIAAMTDVMGGIVDFSLMTQSSSEPHIKSGRLKALAVTNAQRSPALPDTPTVAELGYQDFVSDGWYAMMLPAGTPTEIVEAYHKALNEALALPSVKERLAALGITVMPGSAGMVDDTIRKEAEMWRKVVAENKIVAD